MSDSIKEAAATYDELLKLPENLVGEIVAGELFASPRPASPHARASSAIGSEIFGPFDRGRGGPGGWWILYEPELHLGRDVLVPDIAGWRHARMPQIPNAAWFDLAPDWICEVVSPSTARLDRTRKMPAYAAQNVAYAWLVDPLAKTLEIYRLTEGAWLLVATHGGNDTVRGVPFEAIEIELATLWID